MTAEAQPALPADSTSGASTPRRIFRLVAIAEAISWTLLIGGMILRAVTGDQTGVRIGGGIHGFVFLSFVVVTAVVAINQRWSARIVVLALVSSVIPWATVPAEIYLDRRGLLTGEWRRTATDDPRDQGTTDRVLRALLARPITAALALLAAIAVVFVILLIVGPPFGKNG